MRSAIDIALRRNFPSRVWEDTGNGFASREATPEDRRRRCLLLTLLSPETDPERKAEIREEIRVW